MIKNSGFSRFELYFIISVIGIIILVAIQRYLTLVEETRRLSFEISAKNFSAAIYNYHTRWILAHQSNADLTLLTIDGMNIQFSPEGWPLAVLGEKNIVKGISITSCLSLWQHFLQTPPSISFTSDTYGSRDYHLNVNAADTCRYSFIRTNSKKLFVDYTPALGEIVVQIRPAISK